VHNIIGTCDNKSKFRGVKISLQKLLRRMSILRTSVRVQYKINAHRIFKKKKKQKQKQNARGECSGGVDVKRQVRGDIIQISISIKYISFNRVFSHQICRSNSIVIALTCRCKCITFVFPENSSVYLCALKYQSCSL
jgi:hypothetical protein